MKGNGSHSIKEQWLSRDFEFYQQLCTLQGHGVQEEVTQGCVVSFLCGHFCKILFPLPQK